MFKKISKVIRYFKAHRHAYLVGFMTLPIRENTVLLEAGQGKNINGNMFAIGRELFTNPKWRDYEVHFVVTKDTLDSARKRFEFYGYKNVNLVLIDSKKYALLLATSKYLFTDNSFPTFFSKREGQIYMNTWHGTPLKYLGASDISNAQSLGNIQKNYLMSDYALFPNDLTKQVFMKDYMLKNTYSGSVLMCDYPRNEVFLRVEERDALRSSLDLNSKQLIAYMPTWRGSGRTADSDIQKYILDGYFKEIDEKLGDDQIFYVNLHFLVGNNMDYTAYKHIRPFPKEYETYDFLNICDVLVTDYSSVFFDFALTGKKIVLFAYDKDQYLKEKGTYFPLEDLPFPIVQHVDDLIDELGSNEPWNYSEFINTYGKYGSPSTSEKVLDLMILGSDDDMDIQSPPRNHKKNILIHGGRLNNSWINHKILKYVEQLDSDEYNPILSFEGGIIPSNVEFLKELPEEMACYSVVNGRLFTFREMAISFIYSNFGIKGPSMKAALKRAYRREAKRLFFDMRIHKVVQFTINNTGMPYIFSEFNCEKEIRFYNEALTGIRKNFGKFDRTLRDCRLGFDTIIDNRNDNIKSDLDLSLDMETIYNKAVRFGNIFPFLYNTKNGLNIVALCECISVMDFVMRDGHFEVNGNAYQPKFLFKKGIYAGKNKRINLYNLKIKDDDISSFATMNPVLFKYTDSEGYGFSVRVIFRIYRIIKRNLSIGPHRILPESNTTAFFVQARKNILHLAVRKTNVSDKKIEKLKIAVAFVVSKILGKSNKILLFEKESSKYEESASVAYEKLIDEGYENAHFIIEPSYPFLDDIKEPYRKNLIFKNTFKHYLNFFRSRTFIGSEALVHSIDLRVSSRLVHLKLNDPSNNYVFLQHGVMYMISLDSASRKFFLKKEKKPRKKNKNGIYRVVVSSELEAQHFINLGGYSPGDLYRCGLPKYDKNTINSDADKIVIMPTWRPWEYNQARTDFTKTHYYNMLERIVDSIPEKFRQNIVILPHPLIGDAMRNSDSVLSQYTVEGIIRYDHILKTARVLITDYSSIAYDAFYRGTNVIFYWEEKDECIENYGERTKLMLNGDNAFGDICYDGNDLSGCFESNYLNPQRAEHIERYKKIVEFHDGGNTSRLIDYLRKDNLI